MPKIECKSQSQIRSIRFETDEALKVIIKKEKVIPKGKKTPETKTTFIYIFKSTLVKYGYGNGNDVASIVQSK